MKKLKRTFSEKLGRLSSSNDDKEPQTRIKNKNKNLVEFTNDLSSSASDSILLEKCECDKLQCDRNDNKMILKKQMLAEPSDEKNGRSNSWSQGTIVKTCQHCALMQVSHIQSNSLHRNRGTLTSLTEEEAMDVFSETNEGIMKKRSQSESLSNRRPRSRRYSSPAYANDPNSPFGKIESYECLELLGEGSYATVYKGKIKGTEQLVALKKVTLNTEEGTPFTAIREVSLLKTLKHANIVTLYDIIHTNTTLTLVFEFMSTDLSLYMEKVGTSKGINPRNAVLFTYQLLRGLEYCHQRKVLHRDLKPQNLLISEIGELKLADFGLARAKSIPTNTYSNEVVTLWYRPPDVLLGSTNYTTSLDMWGVGCIFLEMLTGTPICPGQTDACDQLGKIFEILGTPTPGSWPRLSELALYKDYYYSCFTVKRKSIQLCILISMLSTLEYGEEFASSLLQYEPSERLSAADAMNHPLFQILPQEIHNLKDTDSILSLPVLKLYPEERPVIQSTGLQFGRIE